MNDMEMLSASCRCSTDKISISSNRVAAKWPRCSCGKLMKVEKNAVPHVQNGVRVVRSRQFTRPVG
jgi:hypothetical protein